MSIVDVLVVTPVELVCVDGVSTDDLGGAYIFARHTVDASVVEEILDTLNKEARGATAGTMTWRRAMSFSAPSPRCPGCGAWTCWCGLTRALSRSESLR